MVNNREAKKNSKHELSCRPTLTVEVAVRLCFKRLIGLKYIGGQKKKNAREVNERSMKLESVLRTETSFSVLCGHLTPSSRLDSTSHRFPGCAKQRVSSSNHL